MTTTSKQPKKWYKRKRIWLAVVAVLLFYFCFVPSRTRFSYETTGVVGHIPLTSSGEVDYFALYEKTYIDKLSPPEENGQRLMIAALGPRVLEQGDLADLVAWEDMPTNEISKKWFNERWIPLCEHLYIDPYRKPMFYEKRGYSSYMSQYFKEQEKNRDENSAPNPNYVRDESNALRKKLTAASWKREDVPEVGKWLDEYSEVLDYFGMSVRKPKFASLRWSVGKERFLFGLLLPDVQANRDFANSLSVRISERVGRGDIEGAWYDVMSLKYLARHCMNDSVLTANMVGIGIDGVANASVKLILANCKPTEEQLAKFIRDLDSLPPTDAFAAGLVFEQLLLFQLLQTCHSKSFTEMFRNLKEHPKNLLEECLVVAKLPFDMNIAGRRLKKIFDEIGLENFEKDKFLASHNPVLHRQFAERLEKVVTQIKDKNKNHLIFFHLPLMHTRSELVAEVIFLLGFPATGNSFERNEAQNAMLRIAIMSERYNLANGKYPDKLEDLVPKYLDMVPIDPSTGCTTFVYKLRDATKEPEPDTKQSTEPTTNKSPEPPKLPYILYSLGPNGKDDNGTAEFSNREFDFVF
ncbi:MAG: hypothetical protein LBJ00_05730 [Planctomycetaceae bacterium]|jgi:hypothetical protein|nr:hypothetical protein [Planctomycetaceae bacterium]